MDVSLALLAAAWTIDLAWGEYPNALHPVVWMGWVIKRIEKIFLTRAPFIEKCGGCFLLLFVSCGFAALASLSISLTEAYPLASFGLAVFWLKSSFALRALGEAALLVKARLESGELSEARYDLRALCSRDAASLDAEQLTEASVSSLAENLSDSLIAPLFFFLIAGIPGAVFYRAVNTLDAMVGYKNHYRHLGWASARCDDLLNWIPARLTALLLVLAGFLLGFNARRGLRTAYRDHKKTPSPNGGWPMAAMAGLLRMRLQKPGVYTLGEALRPSGAGSLREAWRITRLAAWLAWALISTLLLIPGSL